MLNLDRVNKFAKILYSLPFVIMFVMCLLYGAFTSNYLPPGKYLIFMLWALLCAFVTYKYFSWSIVDRGGDLIGFLKSWLAWWSITDSIAIVLALWYMSKKTILNFNIILNHIFENGLIFLGHGVVLAVVNLIFIKITKMYFESNCLSKE